MCMAGGDCLRLGSRERLHLFPLPLLSPTCQGNENKNENDRPVEGYHLSDGTAMGDHNANGEAANHHSERIDGANTRETMIGHP